MPAGTDRELSAATERAAIEGVIIATDPTAHVPYVRWALAQGLPVLLDKPVSSRVGAISDIGAAISIEEDCRLLIAALEQARARGRICVSVCAHRRWHPAIDAVLGRIRDVNSRTGCPVTNIHCHHSDGQWRLPEEMLNPGGHTYTVGHGKASHSGHHFFDCAWRYIVAGSTTGKAPDGMQVSSSLIQPAGHLRHLTRADYISLFGLEYEQVAPHDDETLARLMRNFGEMDVAAIVTFTSGGVPVCNATFDLLHSGWSRRSWLHPSADLYKGNGRVKHEHQRIHVGPFLAAHIDSYQSKDRHEWSDADDLRVGGNNHYEVRFFNNTGILGDLPPLEILTSEHWTVNVSELLIEQVKEGALHEFVSFLRGEIDEEAMRSPLEDHLVPTLMLSGIYRSHIQRQAGQPSTIEYRLPAFGARAA